MFYYAILNENMFVVELVASETEITDSNHILITEDQYTNGDLLWLYYKPDSGQFIVCDNFIGSSDWIIYKNTDRPITPKFDVWDAKADGDHNHDEDYATIDHTHTEYAAGTHNHNDLYAAKTHETDTAIHVTTAEKTAWNAKAAADHNHDSTYANINHGHTDYAATEHTHNAATTAAAGFMSATDKAKLDGIAAGATAYVHPTTHPASMITGLPTSLPANGGNADTVDNCHATDFASAMHDHDSSYAAINHNHTGTYANAIHTHTDYAATSHSHSTATTAAAGFMAAADKAKLDGVAANANNYSHPASHSASMITGLADVATSGSYNDLSNKPTIPAAYTHPSTHSASMITETDSLKFLTAAERTKLSGIAENANLYTHPTSHEMSMITGLETALAGKAAAGHSHSYSDLTNKPSTFTPAAHIHAQSDITGLETALAGKAATNHTEHNGEIIANKTAGAGVTLQTSYGKTRIHKNSNATSDYGTIISDYDTTGKRDYLQIRRSAPSVDRKLYLMSESTDDSSVSQYKIYGEHNKPGILWSGVVFPGSTSVITLSKTLSECRGGVLLLWSDYDSATSTVNDYDFVTTIIPRMSPTGGTWNGEIFLCDVPRYIGSDINDITTESRIIKRVKIYDNKIEGYSENSYSGRADVVLRCVIEY